MDLPYSFGAVSYSFVRYGPGGRPGRFPLRKNQVKKHYPNGKKRGMI